jgi:anaerobic selenocysteine-containing dehydrogenase
MGVVPAPKGVPGNRVGELGRVDVRGYQGRNPATGLPGAARRGVATSCLQCVAICGVVGYEENGRIVKIEGNPHVPNNRGMVCSKAQAGLNQVYDPDRILYPLVRVGKRGEGRWKRLSMKEALDLAAYGGTIAGRKVEGLKAVYESGKPEAFMLHYGRSRIKAALNNFCKTGMGSGTVGNHTSICETGKWVGQELTLGKHYDINDAANSRYILNLGCNMLEAHTSHSYFAQRCLEGRNKGAKLVTFDVRLSNTAAMSDEWVPIRPGTDLAVILAITHVVLNEQPDGKPMYDERFIRRWTSSTVAELKAHYAPYTPEWAEHESSVPAETIRRIALEYGSAKPATVVTYRGFVGHYNGAYAEVAAKALEAISGNLMVKGGTHMKISGKWADPYKSVAKQHPEAVRKARKLDVIDGEGIELPTHHVSQWVLEMIASGKKGRPKVYMTYCWNGAYTTGDNARNREILANEEYFPFIIAVDTSMGETTEMADLILPDATYLERWTAEAPQSYALIPFIQLRQPVTKPLGEAMDMQDIFIQLARRIGGGISELHPYDTAEQILKASMDATAATAAKAGKKLLGVDGRPLAVDAWSYIREYGVILQGSKPVYMAHEKKLNAKQLKGTVVDKATGTIWNPQKAHVKAADVKAKGYRGSKKAYKGYAGQMVDGVAYKGFKPDKFNKSGLVEIKSGFLAEASKAVWVEIKPYLRPDEAFLEAHLASGLPSWVPVPEHRRMAEDQLVMTSYKVNVQIHSRSQNCKWLQEIFHNNPAWMNPATARRLLGPDVKEGDMIEIRQTMPAIAGSARRQLTKVRKITTKVRLTEGIHPDVVAVSFHAGHWAHGRYASGKALDAALTGAAADKEHIWWQQGVSRKTLDDPTRWNDLRGVHPNWIIPNTPARLSGQYRSNDTLVSVRRI